MQNNRLQSIGVTSTNDNDDAGTLSTLISRNVTVKGRRTSIRLEPEMWRSLKEIALRERCSIHDICTLVSLRKKDNTSLTAAIRVFVMLYYKAAATEEGHRRAAHGDFESMKRRARINGSLAQFFSKKRRSALQDRSHSLDMDSFAGVL